MGYTADDVLELVEACSTVLYHVDNGTFDIDTAQPLRQALMPFYEPVDPDDAVVEDMAAVAWSASNIGILWDTLVTEYPASADSYRKQIRAALNAARRHGVEPKRGVE
jgi:hypothetical protein